MKNLFTISLLLLASNILNAQSFAKTMGGTLADFGRSVAVDAAGNVYTTGFYSGTADFDPGTGTFNLTSAGGSDIFVSKFDAAGNFVWARSMGGTNTEFGFGITVDASGNVYTTGYFLATADFDPGVGTFNLTSAGSADMFISKLNAAGNFVWAKIMGGAGAEVAYGITADASGNIYTTGYFSGTADFDPGAGAVNLTSAGGQDIFVSKLDAAGNFVWAKSIGGIFGDVAYGISTDASGNVYTTGSYQDIVDFDPGIGTVNLTSVGGADIFISKLDAAGNFVWAKSMGGSSGDIAYGISTDVSGNVYTTGNYLGTADFDPGAGTVNLISAGGADVFVSKLDISGNFVWAKSVGGIAGDIAYGISADASGNVYTTGYYQGTADFDPGAATVNLTSAGGTDIFISKLDASGNFVWAKSMGGTTGEAAYGISADASGNVYTTGNYLGTADFDPGAGTANLTSAGSNDIFVSKLNPSGLYTPAATGLHFDGVNDYINCGNSSMLNLTASLSLEAWINRSTAGTDDCIIGKDVFANGTGYALWVYQNNKFVLRFSNREYSSVSAIAANVWTHVAATYDAATTTLKLYINGVLDATFTSVAVPVSNTGNLFIGTPQDAVANASFAFGGSMDEVRIWNRTLVQSEIQNNMNCSLSPVNQTGLLVLYHFDQGIVLNNNSTVTSLTDTSGNNNNGTLTNFALAGAASNWVAGTVTVNCSPAATGLNFDGVNDYVDCGNSAGINNLGLSGFTLEAWVKVSNPAATNSIIRKTGDYNFYVSGNKINVEYWPDGVGNTNFWQVSGMLTIAANTWTHVAATWDGTTASLYVNGVLNTGAFLNTTVGGSENMWLGRSSIYNNPFGGSMDEVRIWNRPLCQSEIQNNIPGGINPATQAGLKAYYQFSKGIVGANNAGLTSIADISGNGNNGTLNTFTLAGSSSNWVLGAATSVAPAFIPSSLAATAGTGQVCKSGNMLNGTTYYIDGACNLIAAVNPSGASPVAGNVNTCVKIDATVQTFNGQPYVQRHYDIEPVTNAATATGTVTLYFTQAEFNAYNTARGAYPALPTGSGDVAGISKLLITQFHGTGTAPGNYSGSSLIIDPADANIIWNNTLSRWQVTFDVSGFSGFYVHTSTTNATLPLNLLNFTAAINGHTQLLQWSTANEINCKYFVIEKSNDGSNFKNIGSVNAKGTGNGVYTFTDGYSLEGTVYYRLKMVDVNDHFTYSNIIRLTNSPINQLTIYPNPVSDKATLQISDKKLMGTTAKIIDATGKTVQTFIIKNNFEKVIIAIIFISVLPMVIGFLNKGKSK
ncbi:MAG: LamG-like jellyroll fold domain-containing protein, partial [Ferruginibacter sp.]